MDWAVVLTVSLIWSAVFVVLFTAILLVGILFARDAAVGDYPPAIQERYGPKSARGESVGRIMAVFMLLLIVGVTVGGVLALRQRLGGDVGFWPGFVFGVTVVLVLHVFDLLILDWLLFCRVQPAFIVLPGTEGMPEYADYMFHVRVLVPRPVPWPLLLIPIYGLIVGTATALT